MAENETEKTSTTTEETIKNALSEWFASMANGEKSESNLTTTTDEAIQKVLDDGFASMTNGERSVNNLSIRDLLELKKQEKREKAEESGNVFGRVKIKNNSTRF